MKSLIQVETNVRFKYIPYEMVMMFTAVLTCGKVHGVQPVITGASYEDYPLNKVHAEGYAIDLRTKGLPDAKSFAKDLDKCLRVVGSHYKVLYGDVGHLDHIHIGFSWYYAREI